MKQKMKKNTKQSQFRFHFNSQTNKTDVKEIRLQTGATAELFIRGQYKTQSKK